VLSLRRRAGARLGAPPDRKFQPVAIAQVELTEPIPVISATDETGLSYGGVRLVVRLHSKIVGVVDLGLEGDELSPQSCAAAIWSALGEKINAHLRDDLLPEVTAIAEVRSSGTERPGCIQRRLKVLEDPPYVSVIICTRNRPDVLRRALASFAALDYPRYELLVIDGSHADETASMVQNQFPHARYFHIGSHGRSFALNRGLDAARGRIVAFTDDDVRVDRYWLAELVSGFDDPRVACVTGAALPMELRTQAQVWFEESGGFTEGFQPRAIELPASPGSLLPFATGKIGAGVNMSWRRDVLLELGGFEVALDTLTPVWPPSAAHGSSGEDLAAFFDALMRGYRLEFNPSAIVFHEHRRTYDELARQIYWHGLGLSAYLFRSLLLQPGQIVSFLKRVPRGVAYGFATSSIRNDKKSPDFPAGLTRAEWRGIAVGPFAYLRGLRRARRKRERTTAGPGP
jgi:glycosyltransferase involved in cell wall biosynthesis